ncbi:sodium:solute symporter [candidate division KSB1 bacterium]|nr:sodium:solute symporter [candidate division KSB1 bacterium]
MQMHAIDVGIILAYVVGVVIIGFYISRKAGENIDSYFLGGHTVPWYVLGVSNASSMFDITGTMWLVYVLFVYGMKGVWLPWLWPTFNQIFLMVYLSIWIRRSNVMTGAEWIKTRFGEQRGAELSRLVVVIFALVAVIGFLTYDFQGIGKFAKVFLPWDLGANTYAVLFMAITTVYVILGGMYSVVLTDVLQFLMLGIASIFIGYMAIDKITPMEINAAIPEGWRNLSFGWKLDLDWSTIIPQVNQQIEADGWSFFTIIFMMILFKGYLISAAGPAPNYDMQRILATRKPKDSALMSGFVSVALFPRWIMIAGITVLALVYFSPQLNAMGTDIDFEMILPYVINNFVPVGVLGLMVAGLLAAFMSTFDSTVNAGAAYLVNDIYKKYINPNAPAKRYVFASYIASVAIVAVGMVFGFMAESINSIMQWIVSGLWGGYTAPNILKWYWWRFNGYGYFWGMLFGIIASLFFLAVFPSLSALNSFPLILLVSTIACVTGSLLSDPDDEEVLKDFYMRVKPWGFWQPIYEKVKQEYPDFQRNTNFKRDMFNVVIGIVWQMTLVVVPVQLVLQNFKAMWIGVFIMVLTTLILKMNWYDKLEKD